MTYPVSDGVGVEGEPLPVTPQQ